MLKNRLKRTQKGLKLPPKIAKISMKMVFDQKKNLLFTGTVSSLGTPTRRFPAKEAKCEAEALILALRSDILEAVVTSIFTHV